MRKFTKEITALLTTAALGATMSSVPASSKEKIRSSGATASSKTNAFGESTTVAIEGTTASDDYFNYNVVTTISGTTASEQVTEPPATMGTTVAEQVTEPEEPTTAEWYLEGTSVSERITEPPTIMGTTVSEQVTEEPPLMGVTAPDEEIYEPGDGDVNDDGEFSLADIVTFQKYLLKPQNVKIRKWRSADVCPDGKLNVFDLIRMKRNLINQKYYKNR